MNVTTIEKECIGCGNGYSCFLMFAETTLYCSDECKERHSLFITMGIEAEGE